MSGAERWAGFKKSSGGWAERERDVVGAGTVRWAGLLWMSLSDEVFTLSGFMVDRILSGRFCPLTAPFPLQRPPAPAPLTLHLIFWILLTAPLRSSQFSARSAPFSAPLTLRSHALFCCGVWGRSPSRNWNWCHFNCKMWASDDIIFVKSWKYLVQKSNCIYTACFRINTAHNTGAAKRIPLQFWQFSQQFLENSKRNFIDLFSHPMRTLQYYHRSISLQF